MIENQLTGPIVTHDNDTPVSGQAGDNQPDKRPEISATDCTPAAPDIGWKMFGSLDALIAHYNKRKQVMRPEKKILVGEYW